MRPTFKSAPRQPGVDRPQVAGQVSWANSGEIVLDNPAPNPAVTPTPVESQISNPPTSPEPTITPDVVPQPVSADPDVLQTPQGVHQETNPASSQQSPAPAQSNIDRPAVVKAINDAGLLTYHVRGRMVSNYLKSMFSLARFLMMMQIDFDAMDEIKKDITEKIHAHIAKVKSNGTYDDLANKVLQFKLNTQVFDAFGRIIDDFPIEDLVYTTDTDIERQFRLAETRLGNEGIGKSYVNRYFDEEDVLSLEIQKCAYINPAIRRIRVDFLDLTVIERLYLSVYEDLVFPCPVDYIDGEHHTLCVWISDQEYTMLSGASSSGMVD